MANVLHMLLPYGLTEGALELELGLEDEAESAERVIDFIAHENVTSEELGLIIRAAACLIEANEDARDRPWAALRTAMTWARG